MSTGYWLESDLQRVGEAQRPRQPFTETNRSTSVYFQYAKRGS